MVNCLDRKIAAKFKVSLCYQLDTHHQGMNLGMIKSLNCECGFLLPYFVECRLLALHFHLDFPLSAWNLKLLLASLQGEWKEM